MVVDKTGLAGSYDGVLDFRPEGVPPNTESADEIGLPPQTLALEKQLGLKLVKQKPRPTRLSLITSRNCRQIDDCRTERGAYGDQPLSISITVKNGVR
jgi:hypothetical protein